MKALSFAHLALWKRVVAILILIVICYIIQWVVQDIVVARLYGKMLSCRMHTTTKSTVKVDEDDENLPLKKKAIAMNL